jgi:ribose transport system substrate-binding protein
MTPRSTTRSHRWVALFTAACALVGAACGDDDSSAEPEDSGPTAAASTGTTAPSAADAGSAASTADASSSSSPSLARAQAGVDAALAPITFKAPGPQFDATADVADDRVTFISVGLNFPYSRSIKSGIEAGAALVGASVDSVDANGDPSTAARQVQTAVSQGSSGIVIQGFPSGLLAEPLRQAKAEGVPVVMVDEFEQGAPTPEQADLGVVGNATQCFACGGKLMAQIAYLLHGDDLNGFFVGSTEFVVGKSEQDAFQAELAELCPDCTMKYSDIGVARWAIEMNPTTASALADQSINAVFPLWDAFLPFMLPAITATQSNDRVSVVTYDATADGLQALQAGAPMYSNMGGSALLTGWYAFDQLLRSWNDQPPAPDSVLPVRLFTVESVQGLDLSVEGADQIKWFGDLDLEAEFKALWGIE